MQLKDKAEIYVLLRLERYAVELRQQKWLGRRAGAFSNGLMQGLRARGLPAFNAKPAAVKWVQRVCRICPFRCVPASG